MINPKDIKFGPTIAVVATETTDTKSQKAESLYVYLSDGFPVLKSFFNPLFNHVATKIPTLKYGKKYTVIDICGQQYWGEYDPGDCKLAGRCMSDMVKEHLFPLKVAETRHEYPIFYELM